MKTRMEKYYNDSGARSAKNRELYSEIYEDDFYTELGLVDSNNEIDIAKVKEMVKNREDYQRAKQYRELLGDKIKMLPTEPAPKEEVEEKVYDINQIMERAKQNRKQEEEDEYRKLSNTQYDVLGKIDINDLERQAQELLEKNRKEEAELKELINTISSKTLAKQTKEALALDLLSDLKETKNLSQTALTIIEEDSPPKPTNYHPVENKRVVEDDDEMDKSFFTTSAIFQKSDFEDLEEVEKTKKVDKILINVLIGLVILIIIILAIFLVKNLF